MTSRVAAVSIAALLAAATALVLSAQTDPPFSLPGTSIQTVAIDAGHGGADIGVKGSTLKEKDLTLAVARLAKTALESRLGLRVVLTREDDVVVSAADRARVANAARADLFVSLHANASPRADAAGTAIYAPSVDLAATRNASTQETPERLGLAGGGTRNVEFLEWNTLYARHAGDSFRLAGLLESTLRGKVPLAARAVDRAPLGPLAAVHAPAVLVELGFLSNPEQERALGTPEFQNAFVQGLQDALAALRAPQPSEGPAR